MSAPRWLWPAVAAGVVVISAALVHSGARDTGARSVSGELVALREATFARFAEDDRLFRASPDELMAAGFLRDSAPPSVGLLRAESSTATDPLAIVQSVLHEIPWRNSPFCLVGGTLAAKAKALGAGRTCCSDNVELFLAELAVEGVFAREVHTHRHVVAEVFVPALSRWVFVDPSYGIMAFDQENKPISVLELRRRYLAKEPVELRFVGGELAREGKSRPEQIDFYSSAEELETISLVLGNNVFDVDASRAGRKLPEAARQAVGLIRGSEPRTMILMDAHSEGGRKLLALRPPLVVLAASSGWLAILGLLRLRRRR